MGENEHSDRRSRFFRGDDRSADKAICCHADCEAKAGWAEMSKWISVDDSLPPIDQICWLRFPNGVIFMGGRGDFDSEDWLWGRLYDSPSYNPFSGEWHGDIEMDDDYEVTHWMPLPEPLEGVQK